MKREDISRAIGGIDDAFIEEAGEAADGRGGRFTQARWFRAAAVAACLIIMTAAGFTVRAFAREAKEYRAAVTFFEDNGLSMDGLSRSELKAVYRDITTKSFTYSKTAEVISRTVGGWQINSADPTPEELAAVWDRNIWLRSTERGGFSFRADHLYVRDEKTGIDRLDRAVLECRREGELIWSAEFDAPWYIEGYSYFPEGTAVWGRNEVGVDSPNAAWYGWFAVVDQSGMVLWERILQHGFRDEYIASVLSNGDGSWAVISRGEYRELCFSRFDAQGNQTSFRCTEVGNYGIGNAVRLNDGYLVRLSNTMSRETALLYRMDMEGNVTGTYSYEADDCEYHLVDMAEFGGKIYLSAYAVPLQKDPGGRHEIADLLAYIFSREDHGMGLTSEELTPMVRENYTAVLLACDRDGIDPKTFYSVKGAFGAALCVSGEGRLEWDVESITSAFFSPATSAFTIGGTCKVMRYTFDSSGTLTGTTDTGQTVPYAR